jgi:salicylate hydroxylase
LLKREPLDHFAEGRVCVMGDAAHPTLPFLAQGANMALEDAVIIAVASTPTIMCRRRLPL